MNSQFFTRTATVMQGTSPSILGEIRCRGCHLAVWERGPQDGCAPAVAGLLLDERPVRWDSPSASEEFWSEALGAFLRARVPDASIRALAGDIARLAGFFCEVADVGHPRIRLERVEDDGCQLFHADTLHLRMLCTYGGPGTEWLSSDNVRWDELGLRGRSLEEANRAIVINPAEVRTLAAWHVAVFSGRLREDTPPLIHRSAPVRSQADHRLRLCLDLPTGCGC